MGPGGLLLRVLAIGVILAARAAAQDPLPLYPENYRVLTENDRVRVLDFRLKRGATERSHAHPEALETHKATPHLRASFERRKSQQWMTEITLWRRVSE